jgi:hypothetical protein
LTCDGRDAFSLILTNHAIPQGGRRSRQRHATLLATSE